MNAFPPRVYPFDFMPNGPDAALCRAPRLTILPSGDWVFRRSGKLSGNQSPLNRNSRNRVSARVAGSTSSTSRPANCGTEFQRVTSCRAARPPKLAVLWSHAGKGSPRRPHSQQAKQIVNGQIKAQLGQRQYPVFPTDRPTLVNSQDGIDRPW